MQVHEKVLTSVPILTPKGAEGGRLYFLPADLGLCQRIDETQSEFLKTWAAIPNANIRPDGSGEDPASEEIISEAEQQFAELLNFVCGLETAPEAFRRYKPFAVMSNGRFWASAVMAALDAALNTVTTNTKKLQKRMKKRR